MKTQVLFLAMFFGVSVMAANQVPNGDFEMWQTGSYSLPTGFPYASNANRFYDAALPYNVEQTTDAHEGQFAVKLTTGQPSLGGDSPNFGYLLNYPPNGSTTEGLPLSETPTGLRGYYKYAPVEGDSGVILASLLKQGVKLADYSFIIKGEQSNYIRFEIPFNKPLNDVPDLIQIGFASSFNLYGLNSPPLGA